MRRVNRVIGKLKKVVRHPATKQAISLTKLLYRISRDLPGRPPPLPTRFPLP